MEYSQYTIDNGVSEALKRADVMPSFEKSPRYRIFLLTIWEERGREAGGSAARRFKLESPRTGRQRVFATLEEVMAAIETTLDEDVEANG